ncbi:hypothetical protein HYALB_00005604 [Hymenoscyphus albidus]|uniref:Uncharacterized protein n=1 Tax=Hymenoscyphus albidus TaxID=595503 RepID=A0A9N9LN09_9HELO|nr:hypothetical protein HYALB_00005604 [Hymenoscyphus albidus]
MASNAGRQSSSGSGTPALSGSTAGHRLPSKEVFFASEWYFLSAGRIDLCARYKKLLHEHLNIPEQQVLKCKWNDNTHCFEITCHLEIADIARRLFVQAMDGIIVEELAKNGINERQKRRGGANDSDSECSSDEDDDSDVTSDFDANYNGDIIYEALPIRGDKIVRLAVLKQERALGSGGSDPNSGYPEVIASAKQKFVWYNKNSADLEYILPPHVVDQLIKLTGCKVFVDFDTSKVYLGGVDEEQIHRAVSKLDNIRKYSQPQLSPIYHAFYTESTDDFELSLKYLNDVKIDKKRMFNTTLLDPLNPRVGDIYTAVTVRCATLDLGKDTYVAVSRVHATGIDPIVGHVREQWANFLYNPTGALDPMRHVNGKPVAMPSPSNPSIATRINSQSQVSPDILNVTNDAQLPVEEKIGNWRANLEGPNVSRNDLLVDNSTVPVPNPSWDRCEGSEEPHYGNLVTPNSQNLSRHASVRTTHMQSLPRMSLKPSAVTSHTSITNQPPQASMTMAQHLAVSNGGPVNPEDFPSLPEPASQAKGRSGAPNGGVISIKANGKVSTPASSRPKPVTTIKSGNIKSEVSPTKQVNGTATRAAETNKTFVVNNDASPTASERQVIGGNIMVIGGTVVPEHRSHMPQSIMDQDIDELPSLPSVLRPTFHNTQSQPNGIQAPVQSPNNVASNRSEVTVQEADQSLLEIVQREPEELSRDYYLTMNQKAPNRRAAGNQSKKNVPFAGRLEVPDFIAPIRPRSHVARPIASNPDPDPLPRFASEVNNYFPLLLADVRGFNGRVHIRLEFGRIMINNVKQSHIADRDGSSGTLTERNLQNILNTSQYRNSVPTNTSFTNALTTAPEEVDFLLTTKSKESLIWNGKCDSWGVMYRLVFHDVELQSRFSVEIDGERFKAKIRTQPQRDFGEIYIHGTKRHWDCRISVTGDDGDTNPLYKDRYSALVKKILDTLYIVSGKEAEVRFEIDPVTSKQFQLVSIQVFRNTMYQSNDGRSVLKIQEIIKMPPPGRATIDDHVVFIANEQSNQSTSDLKKWFVVSIESNEANQLVKQNESMELGEEAGWTPETMASAGVAKDLYLPACAMLTSMCGVGINNGNGLVARKNPRTVAPPGEATKAVSYVVVKSKKFWIQHPPQENAHFPLFATDNFRIEPGRI